MATTTTNLALTKSAGSENYSIDIVNANLDKIDAGCVNVNGTQTIPGVKTFTGENGFNIQNDGASGHYAINLKDTILEKDVNPSSANYPFYIRILDKNGVRLADPMGVRFNNNGSGQIDFVSPRINGSVGSPDFQILSGYVCAKSRNYSASNTYDVVTISSLQASTDVVHTSGNEEIYGVKSFHTTPTVLGNSTDMIGLNLKNEIYGSVSENYNNGRNSMLNFTAGNGDLLACLRYRSGQNQMRAIYADLYKSDGTAVMTTLIEYDGVNNVLSVPVHTTGDETITGTKTLTSTEFVELDFKSGRTSGNLGGIKIRDGNNTVRSEIYGGMSNLIIKAGNYLSAFYDSGYATVPSRTYNASNTTDVVTIGSLQASTDVIHTSGNETISGLKKVSALGASAGAIYVTTSQSVDIIRTSLGTANYTYHIPVMWGTHYDGGFAMLSITVTAGMPTAISSVHNSPLTKQTKFGARKEDDYLVISMTPAGNSVMSAMAFGCSRGSGVYTGEDMSVYGTINTTSSLQNYVQEV